MNKRIPLLAALLVVQALLVFWFWLPDQQGDDSSNSLINFSVDDLSQVVLSDTGGQSVELVHVDSGWRIGELPADDAKIDTLLTKLQGLDTPWPVATTVDSQARFEVSADSYQRRLVITGKDGAVQTLFLGTSPGFRRTHARLADSEAIYSIDLANHELPLAVDDWLDRGLLATRVPVTDVRWLEQWQVTQSADGWNLRDLRGGSSNDRAAIAPQPANAKTVESLLQRFSDLQVLGQAKTAGTPVASFTLTAAGTEYTYALAKDEDADSYGISRSDTAGQYQIANYVAEQMMLSIEDLVAKAEANAEPSTAIEDSSPLDGAIDEVMQNLPSMNGR